MSFSALLMAEVYWSFTALTTPTSAMMPRVKVAYMPIARTMRIVAVILRFIFLGGSSGSLTLLASG